MLYSPADRCLARLGPGTRAGASIRLPATCRVAHGLRGPGAARAGEAHEGFARLEVAVPSQLDDPGGSSIREDGQWVAQSQRVVIGMDPHKRSVTIEVMACDEAVLGGGWFAPDAAGYEALLEFVRRWPERVWAIEGCRGIGRHVALRLLGDGQEVVDVPPKLSARARVFATGQGRKTDAPPTPTPLPQSAPA